MAFTRTGRGKKKDRCNVEWAVFNWSSFCYMERMGRGGSLKSYSN